MNSLLLNRDFQPPADGMFQIVAMGEIAFDADGEKITQVVDADALQRMCNRFAESAQQPQFAGMLVDRDHFSLDVEKESRAAGWITNCEVRADGLYAKIRWTPEGDRQVKEGEYRFCSPVFNRGTCEELGGGRIRPTELLNIALTNDPRMKNLKPLSNRADVSGTATGPKAGKDEKMNEIAKKLGLAETATPEEVGVALDAKLARLAELETATADTQAEADMAPFKGQIDNCAEVKKTLMANREAGLAILKALKPAPVAAATDTTAKTLPNRASAKMPTFAPVVKNRMDEQNRLVNSIRKREGCSFDAAWKLAQEEKPELFATSAE